MEIVTKHQVEIELGNAGCEPYDKGGNHACGLGQWWVTGLGSKFFIQWVDDEGNVDETILRRLVVQLARTRPMMN